MDEKCAPASCYTRALTSLIDERFQNATEVGLLREPAHEQNEEQTRANAHPLFLRSVHFNRRVCENVDEKKTTTEERKKKRKLKQNRDKNSDSTNWSFCYFRSTCVQLTYFMVMPLHDFELLRDRRYTSREVYFYCIIFFRVIISYLQNASATKYCNRNFINKTGKKSQAEKEKEVETFSRCGIRARLNGK